MFIPESEQPSNNFPATFPSSPAGLVFGPEAHPLKPTDPSSYIPGSPPAYTNDASAALDTLRAPPLAAHSRLIHSGRGGARMSPTAGAGAAGFLIRSTSADARRQRFLLPRVRSPGPTGRRLITSRKSRLRSPPGSGDVFGVGADVVGGVGGADGHAESSGRRRLAKYRNELVE